MKSEEIKKRNNEQRTRGIEKGFRMICRSCDFIFYTDTWKYEPWDKHQEKTGHTDYYDIPVIKER